MTLIRLAAPAIDEEDQRAVGEVLASGWLSGGPSIAAFEEAVAERCGVSHGVAVSSGTAALVLGLEALGMGEGDEVLVPGFTYIATAHAAALVGATPRLVDVHRETWNMDPARIAEALSTSSASDRRALMVVDQFGLLADLEAIHELTREQPRETLLLEDAACALGATDSGGRRCGHAPAALACLSFHPRKVITCGEGGIILTNDAALAAELRERRNHGRDDRGRFRRSAGNQRLSSLGAALGLSQLRRLESFIARRRELAGRYRERLEPLRAAGLIALQRPDPGHVYQTFAVALEGEPDPQRRDDLIAALRARGVESGIATTAVHQHPPYDEQAGAPLPVAHWLGCNGFALPLHMALHDDDVETVCDALEACLSALGGQRSFS